MDTAGDHACYTLLARLASVCTANMQHRNAIACCCTTRYRVQCTAGKSAGMILRQINAGALADARTLHLEQTCDMLRACCLSRDSQVAGVPAPPGAPASPAHQAHAR